MRTPEEVWRILLPHLAPLPLEDLPRHRAIGRVLARALSATVDVPGNDVSAMDGYALTGEARPGDRWPVVGRIAAGDRPGFLLPEAAAVRIMTGAPVPANADRVLPVEETDGGRDEVEMRGSPARGAHIRRRGEILLAGDPLLPEGSLLTPGALALLATHGYPTVPVFGAPRVAVVTTGDELVEPGREPAPGQLRDSNTDFLLAAGASLGLDFDSLGIATDDLELLAAKVARGLTYDVLLLTGGVSMGELDLVEEALTGEGCRLLFDAVAIQPGKPLVAAVREADRPALVFALPGNPASVMVGFWLFVRPALRRLLGYGDGFWGGAVAGELAAPSPGAGSRDRFLPAEIALTGGALLVTPQITRGSHDLAAYARGTALLRVPAGSSPLEVGERCEVLPLADWRWSVEPRG